MQSNKGNGMSEDTYIEGELYENPDFELRHFMRDVILLLGAPIDIADLLDKSKDGMVTSSDVNRVRNYACELFNEHKTRMASLRKLKIRTEPDPL